MSDPDFRLELERLINRQSMENGSNTPDFILAEYLADSLAAFDRAVAQRERWYGREKVATGGSGPAPEEPKQDKRLEFNPLLYKGGQAPHCDQWVLHQPGQCDVCDEYGSAAQQERIALKINFTGQTVPGRRACPSDLLRGTGKAHVWSGNRPVAK